VEQSNIWIITLIALAIGALIGYLLGRAGGSSNREQELVDELDSARSELEQYKTKVGHHFEETAELVNGLSEQYRKVHQHLANSAESLCPGLPASMALQHEAPPKLGQDIPTVTDALDNSEQEELPEPPRDYAPKKSDEAGTLSESYGLSRKEQAEAEEHTKAPAAHDPTAYGDDAPEDDSHKRSSEQKPKS
jgi:uncharacterized membrane-anchored protein YhcB (DUF1043 family)